MFKDRANARCTWISPSFVLEDTMNHSCALRISDQAKLLVWAKLRLLIQAVYHVVDSYAG
jgi:hypothetical protein